MKIINEIMTVYLFVERELITPPLNGLILPGITRHSIIQMTESWNEFKVSERVINMNEIIHLLNSNRVRTISYKNY